MPDPCECPMRKALEHLRKSCEGTLLLAYIDAALSAPCPCGELREGGERLKEELRYEVRNAAWEAEQAQSATAERDQLRAELAEALEALQLVMKFRAHTEGCPTEPCRTIATQWNHPESMYLRPMADRAAAVLAKHPEVKA